MPRKAAPKAVEIDRSHTPVIVASIVVLGVLVTGGIIYWGSHESGQINVNEKISHSQSAQVSDGGVVTQVGTVLEAHRSLPNGGLQAQGGTVAEPPQPEVLPVDTGTSTATSTEAGTAGEEGSDTSETTPPGEGATVSAPAPSDAPGTDALSPEGTNQ